MRTFGLFCLWGFTVVALSGLLVLHQWLGTHAPDWMMETSRSYREILSPEISSVFLLIGLGVVAAAGTITVITETKKK